MFKILVLLVACVLFSFSAFAADGFEAMMLQPAVDDTPYIGIWGSKSPDQLDWRIGTLATYAYRPMQLTAGGNRDRGIIDHMIVQHVYGSLGIIDRWLSAGVDLPVGWWLQFKDPNVVTATNKNKMSLGDVTLNLKSELVSIDHFGMAIVPFITFPSGKGEYFFGNGSVTGGGKLVAEVSPVENWQVAVNAGIAARKKFEFRNIEKSHQLLLGLGTAVRLSDPLSIVAELESATRLSGIFSEKGESPTEARGSIKWNIGKTGFLANAGGGVGILRNSGAPTYRVFAGLSFSPKTRAGARSGETPSAGKIDNVVVHFDYGSAQITNDEEAAMLGRFADEVRNVGSATVDVKGYADDTGSSDNQKLAEKRAGKVKWYLNLRGVEESKINAKGFVEKGGGAKNRRVEVTYH